MTCRMFYHWVTKTHTKLDHLFASNNTCPAEKFDYQETGEFKDALEK